MKKRKNIKWALLLVLLLFLTFGAAASAATTYTHKYFNYQMDGESIVITNYFGSESTVTVPSLISGYPVSKIAKNAFTQNNKVKHVNLPDTIMEVEEGAFSGLISVTYASNTDNPVDTIPEVEPETAAPDKNTNNGAEGNVKEEVSADGSSASGAETESQDSPFSTPTISEGASTSSNASAEVSAEEVEAQILALEESQKKNDAQNSVSDAEVFAETESETTLSAETETVEAAETESETEAMTESELESETAEAADSGKDFPFAIAAVAVIAALAVFYIVRRRKK